tara:strand:+ start:292 stop:471 length:180 start_codon:yes stop_codon:yes gene_type:complete
MGALLGKVIQVLKIMPFILYFTKNNKIKFDSEQELFEDEWGQFCEIEKPLHNNNRDNPL